MDNLRILSLLPAATEIVYLLGLEKYLVGVSHECDFPFGARLKPKVSSSPISNDLTSGQINEAVAKLTHKGSGVFHIDQKLLAQLRPNLILTQELCKVCAISWTEVKKAAKILESRDKYYELRENIVSLEPESIEGILEDIRLVGKLCGLSKKADIQIENLQKRLKFLNSKFVIHSPSKPKVLIIEWFEPLMVAGHWVPEMVERAFGRAVKIHAGHKSYPITIDQIIQSSPDIVVIAPCGFDIKRTLREKSLINDLRLKIGDLKCEFYLMDGNSYLTRPGPRIIDGVEILAEILHPEVVLKKHSDLDWLDLNNVGR